MPATSDDEALELVKRFLATGAASADFLSLRQIRAATRGFYDRAGVLVCVPAPDLRGLEPEEMVWDNNKKVFVGLYVPQWALAARESFRHRDEQWLHAPALADAIRAAHLDHELRDRFITLFCLCGDTFEERMRIVLEVLVWRE